MLTIWGRLSSINVRKVVLCAQELGLVFERIDAGGSFGVVGTPEFLSRNPNGMVPLIQDGDYFLWESNVIVRYLCASRQSPLYPVDARQRFEAECWMDWQQTTLNPAGRQAFLELIRQPGGQSDMAKVEASVSATLPLLDMLEARLSRQPWLAGDHLTMADLPIACEIHRWYGLPLAHAARPHLDRWYQALLARPSARGPLDTPLS